VPIPTEAELPPIPPYQLGQKLTFGSAGDAQLYTTNGWQSPEESHRWTDGNTAEMRLPLAQPIGDALLTVEVFPVTSGRTPAQTVHVFANGAEIGQWQVDRQSAQHLLVFASHSHGRDSLELRFELPDAFSPHSHGTSADNRILALAFQSLRLDPLNAPSV
jgi:hypothetical protein